MPRDPLRAVLRLRRLALDEARRELGHCLAAEAVAIADRKAAEAAIQTEEQAAAALDADDGAVEAFAAWLPRGRQAIAQAEAGVIRAETATAQARARLTAARAAAEAAEQMMDARFSADHDAQARRDQAALDDAARPRPAR
jgi:flagellar export protein FliJ